MSDSEDEPRCSSIADELIRQIQEISKTDRIKAITSLTSSTFDIHVVVETLDCGNISIFGNMEGFHLQPADDSNPGTSYEDFHSVLMNISPMYASKFYDDIGKRLQSLSSGPQCE
eukprot:PhF_6_TR39423/c0_g1_i2/m.58616